jgi:hypothetical protein
MDDAILEVTGASEEVLAEFRRGFQAQAVAAAVAQERLNEVVARNPSRMIDGVGQLVGRVNADVYHLMRHKHGEEVWSDPLFRKRAVEGGLMCKPGVMPKMRAGFSGGATV